jgi:hypothetical protein
MAKPFEDIKRNGTMISDIACFECGEYSLKYLGDQSVEQNEHYPFVVACMKCLKTFYYDHDSKEFEEVNY